mmetsp:Transcript_41213/g.98702  ORF Transcript_41213/g.98702 Transcript_41213/m.98702 type:complete len:602 (-) Transcript_41213:120-1925(-)
MNDGGSSAASAAAAAASNTAGGGGSSGSGIEFILPFIAVSAAALMGTLAVLQTDAVSRRLLSEETNDNKRRNEYKYAWQTGIEKVKIQLDYYLAGGMKNFEEDPDVVWKIMEYVHEDEDLEHIINDRILDKNSLERFSVLKIDKDPNDPKDEWYLFLLNDDDNGEKVVYEFPLVKFALKLAKAFEDRVTTTTMVFLADASSGKAVSMIESLVQEAKANVAILSEPFWMIQFAGLVEASIFPSSKMDQVLFSLCRLEAWSLRRECQQSRTVLVTLPGMATVPTLLPMLQRTFPEDRHIFAYDGCVASVQSGVYEQRRFRRGRIHGSEKEIIYGMCNDPVRITTPFPSTSPLVKDASLKKLAGVLTKVPISQARIVETWMSSVDAYFKLKQTEKTTGYLPYVFKLGFLTPSPVGNFETGSDSCWSLRSLLQFITGCRSRPLPEGVFDAAREWLKDYNEEEEMKHMEIRKSVHLSEGEKKAIENCVFQHKSILIGNKTLQDTVLPREHWTLKQASRAGCSCCGPDPYDQEEDEDAGDSNIESTSADRVTTNAALDMAEPGAFATAIRGTTGSSPFAVKSSASAVRTAYVDGTQGFAFDPSRFSA